jgi:hypothetical protein
MEPTTILDLETALDQVSSGGLLVHDWRVEQLCRAGVPRAIADAVAGTVDWREIADLVQRGCPPELAVEIVR